MSVDPSSAAAPDARQQPSAEWEPRLSACGVGVRYGETVALDGVDLVVRDGESVAVMGPSGSGKSTLLHALAGIISPDEGTVTLRTRGGVRELGGLSDAARSGVRLREYGFVFQQGMLIPELTAIENVALALMLNGTGRREAEQQASGWLTSLGLAGMEDRRIGQLSGGQAQRVSIARAQVTGASVIFADEPTGALDSTTSAEVMDALLGSTVGQGRTLVVVTHNDDVAARCSRIVSMRDGRITGERVTA